MAPVQHGNSPHNLSPMLYTGNKEKHLIHSGDKALGGENTQPMVSPIIPQGAIDQSPNHAHSTVSSGHKYRQSLLSSKGLSHPEPHDENAHHVVPCNPYLVSPTPSNKLCHSTNMLYGCDPVNPGITASHLHRGNTLLAKVICPIAKNTCRACAVPNRYIVHYYDLIPEFLSQIDVSSDVLGESPETTIPIDSGYHSPQPTIPACLDASSNPVSMVPVSTKGGTLVDLSCHKDKVISQILCKSMGCPDVKIPGQVLSFVSTPRVSRENLTNAHSIFALLGKFETFAKPNYSTPCNCIVGPIEEKMLPSPIKFPAQSMAASHPLGVDEYLDSVPWAPTPVQPTSTHECAITSLGKPLYCLRLVLMAKGQPQ